MRKPEHSVKFTSSDDVMNRSFEWAKKQAFEYVREGYPAGDAYEATLPGRDAFCMRDVSHMCVGAHFLGLQSHNRNMMHHFAKNISESKDWCSYWEITYNEEPCPVDYTDDRDFWYNLPANFDVTTSCGKLYDLTGDIGYLTDDEMLNFHRLTLTKYAEFWDRDHDGLVDRVDSDGRRGIASYDESHQEGYRAAGDTIGVETAAFREGARIMRFAGDGKMSAAFLEKADALAESFRRNWWNEKESHYNTLLYADGTTGTYFSLVLVLFPVEYGLITDREKLKAHLKFTIENEHKLNIEERSYLAAILWKNGECEYADKIVKLLSSDGFPRREYPEVSFSTVDAIVTGYMGLKAEAETGTLTTESHVPEGQWAEIADTPLWGGSICLRHEGMSKSVLTNNTGRKLIWKTGERQIEVADGETASVC